MALGAYNKYLSQGASSGIELHNLDSMEEPLLSPTSMAMHQQAFASQQSLSKPPSLYHNGSREAPLHRPQDRSYSPSPAYVSTDNLNQGRSPISPYPSSEQSHQSYFTATPTSAHQRQTSGNVLGNPQGRSQSPGPYNAMQYPPQQHGRQASGNILAGPPSQSGHGHSPTQSQTLQQQHARQNSGNMLASPAMRTPSPGPNSAYSPQQQQQYHARQASGNMLNSSQARTPSPGPYQAYSPAGQPQQHARQGSGNMLANPRIQSPGPYQAYASQQRPSGSPAPGYQQQPPGLQQPAQYQQQYQQDNANANLAGRGARRGPGY